MAVPITLEKLIERVLTITSFAPEEINISIAELSAEESFNLLNRYHGLVIKGPTSYLNDPSYQNQNIKLIEVLMDPTNPLSDVSNFEGMTDIAKGVAPDFGVSWARLKVDITLDNLHLLDSELLAIFHKLFLANVKLLVGNRRRSVLLNELPFDLKGDDYVSEAKDSLKELETLLINNMRSIY